MQEAVIVGRAARHGLVIEAQGGHTAAARLATRHINLHNKVVVVPVRPADILQILEGDEDAFVVPHQRAVDDGAGRVVGIAVGGEARAGVSRNGQTAAVRTGDLHRVEIAHATRGAHHARLIGQDMSGDAGQCRQCQPAQRRCGEGSAVQLRAAGFEGNVGGQRISQQQILGAAVAHIAHGDGVVDQLARRGFQLRHPLVDDECRCNDGICHVVRRLQSAFVIQHVTAIRDQRAGRRRAGRRELDRDDDDLLCIGRNRSE